MEQMTLFDCLPDEEAEKYKPKKSTDWKWTMRLTCRDPEGRARLMPDVDLMAVIERLCQIEELGKGMLIMPRAEQQIAVSAGLRRKWKERRKNREQTRDQG